MSWVGYCLIVAFFGVLIFLGLIGCRILKAQKSLDTPFRGYLVVDKNNIDGQGTLVYIDCEVHPSTFTDGEAVKLIVKVKDKDSQCKQVRE